MPNQNQLNLDLIRFFGLLVAVGTGALLLFSCGRGVSNLDAQQAQVGQFEVVPEPGTAGLGYRLKLTDRSESVEVEIHVVQAKDVSRAL